MPVGKLDTAAFFDDLLDVGLMSGIRDPRPWGGICLKAPVADLA
jgi:hypothetical protein